MNRSPILSPLLTLLFACHVLAQEPAPAETPPTPMFEDRVVAFHGGPRKELIELAAELGYNEAQFHLEMGNVEKLKQFAAREEQEAYVKFFHSLGMKVSLWIHELEDLPKDIGPIALDNDALWKLLDERYAWVLGELLSRRGQAGPDGGREQNPHHRRPAHARLAKSI